MRGRPARDRSARNPEIVHCTTSQFCRLLTASGVAVTWAHSADKHGIPHEDALHAIGNASYVESEFDEPRIPSPGPAHLVHRATASARRPVTGSLGGSDSTP